MELFDLVAKLTLDSKEYERALDDAERHGGNIQDIEASLDLDTSEFDSAVQDVENTDVADPESPDLDLNTDPFDTAVASAEEESVDDPETPDLDLNTEAFNSELEDASENASLFSTNITSVFEEIKGALATAGIVAAVKSITDGLSEAVDLARSMGDNIDKSSRAMSISTDAYQEWSHVLDINGASITDLNRGLMNMRKFMGGGEPSKEFAEAMDTLGLSTKIANGEISNTEDLLDATMKALADFSDDADQRANRDYLAQAIFGRGGTKLNAMFDGTSQDIENLKQQAHDLGLVMSEEEVANAAAYNDSVTNMQASITAFKTMLVSEILPPLTDLTNKVATIVAFFNPRTHETGLSQQLSDADAEFAETLTTIEGTGQAAMDIVDKLLLMGDAEKLTAEQTAEWKANADWLIKNIPDLSDVIDKDTLKLTANKDEIEAIIKKWQTLSKERALANAKEAKYAAIVTANQSAIDKQVEARQKENEALKAGYAMVDKVNELMAMRGSEERLEYTQEGIEEAYRQGSGANINRYSREEQAWSAQFDPLSRTWSANNQEAEKLRKEAASLAEEAQKADEDFKEWSKAADELFANIDSGASESETSINSANAEAEKYVETLNEIPSEVSTIANFQTVSDEGYPKAKGDMYVPYDNYPALLHRGEAVLTATEARQYREGNSGNLDIAALVNAIEGAVRNGMENANVRSYLNGKDITDEVSKTLNADASARRYMK